MYRNVSSPIFDIPEFPPLRRVKPLPKRRRTSSPHISILNPGLPPIPLSLPGPDATAKELLAHADALQSYYLPILDAAAANITNLAALYGAGFAGLGFNNLSLRDREEGSDHGDGDYIDHLQQPANTKKRKVPANMSRLQGAHDFSSAPSGEDEVEDHVNETLMIGIPTGEGKSSISISTMRRLLVRRKTRLSAVTIAGLQHKETVKVRKRQLAVVLGALSHGDMLALDQALTNNSTYPFSTLPLTSSPSDDILAASGINASNATGVDGRPSFKIRLSKRAGPRMARRVPLRLKENEEPHAQVPESDFAFVCHSATADRLAATKKEVAILRRRFEDALARQASNAASLAAATRAVASSVSNKSSRQKRGDRARTDKKPRDQPAEVLDPTGNVLVSGTGGISSRDGKKKKRSALANASNPHHLRNYVPSRLPYSVGGCPPNTNGLNQTNANDLGPFPLRFLSAEIPPRRSTRSKRSQTREQQQQQQQSYPTSTSLTNPTDEWLCVFCEYELFFGDEGEYRKALRRRKTVLKRRRRARERAAAAASGEGRLSTAKKSQQPAPVTTTQGSEEEGDGEDDYDNGTEFEPIGTLDQPAGNGVNGMLPKQTKWRGDNREKGAGGEENSYG
ncbi:hypothetical protein J3R30DRAFT_3301707 [Lentinula aciculospora]|uniref:Uncharacterized protein n=1 Tax=Lentinula aciculospora TaxID=153920 RepID=A0A9W9DH41_9AGAR|nr:hypothetical protein J3R30DRAFT_3301707 [Lentinula aciculospora]